mmetsp:Transcript_18766/g.54263  ORF Transcript_18766/g.54263 Transcript_18766/m.54263 type:complete len:206 (+) Transcript_18766:873-1490(+)
MSDLEKTLSGLVFSNKSSSDELHEDGEIGAEPLSLLTEKRRLGNAAGVHTAEGNSSQLVVLGVKEISHHHKAKLAVLVCLGADESISISHRNRVYETCLETFQVMKIRNGIYTATSDSVVISGNGSNHNNTCIWGVDHTLHELTDHQEMRQKVNLHGLFVVVDTPLGVVQRWLVDPSIADKTIDGLGHAELVEIIAEFSNRFEGV